MYRTAILSKRLSSFLRLSPPVNSPEIESPAFAAGTRASLLATLPKRVWRWLGIELNVVSFTEKAVSGIGGFLAILSLILITGRVLDLTGSAAVIASMGASAVLLFALPHGQLSQPWPVIGGHVLSALIGVACARWIASPEVAAACAVGLAIAVMHQLKCIHPPGGATALTAVLGGQAVHEMGYHFVLLPVLLNCVVMVGLAVAINLAFRWRRYPVALRKATVIAPPHPGESIPTHDEIVAALRRMDLFVDVSEDDLIELCRILAERPPQELGGRNGI